MRTWLSSGWKAIIRGIFNGLAKSVREFYLILFNCVWYWIWASVGKKKKSTIILSHNSSPETGLKRCLCKPGIVACAAIPTFRGLRQEDSMGYISNWQANLQTESLTLNTDNKTRAAEFLLCGSWIGVAELKEWCQAQPETRLRLGWRLLE